MIGDEMEIEVLPAAPEDGMVEVEEPAPDENPSGIEPGVDLETLRAIVKQQAQDAVNYCEEDLAGKRTKWYEAYLGEAQDGDDCLDDTRSRAMSKDVHDVVHAILPSVMRTFCGTSAPVDFLPTGPEDVGAAQQATDYVNDVVLALDNDFFTVMYSAASDALIKGLGVFKFWWEPKTRIEGGYYSGLDPVSFQVLAGDPNVKVDDYEEIQTGMGSIINCHVVRTISEGGQVKIEAIPPEERLISAQSRSIADADMYGHRRTMSVSDMVAMSFNYEQIVSFSGGTDYLDTNEEAVERFDDESSYNEGSTADPAMRTLEVVEMYLKVDLDGDGIAERYQIFCGGDAYEILERDEGELAIELWEDIPFAEICPDPVPHLATGNSVSNQVTDVQYIKTNLLRGSLDSLSRSIFPREEIVEGQVNVDDAMNPEIGAMIRVRAPGMIREIITPFMGKEAMPLMQYMDEVKADRTGISDATMGLNPKTLQSSTQDAVENTTTAAQSQIELICRLFARGVSDVYKGILRLIKQNQDQNRTVRLRNTWVEVDPRTWNSGMDAKPKLALGRGNEKDRLSALNMIAGKQEQIIASQGPQSALLTLAQYRNTLAEMVNATGYYQADQFFLPTQMGEQVGQMQQQNQQLTQENQQLQQQAGMMQQELIKRSQAAADKDTAAAFKSMADAFQSIIEGTQQAALATVPPDAALDEQTVFMGTPMRQPQGPQQ